MKRFFSRIRPIFLSMLIAFALVPVYFSPAEAYAVVRRGEAVSVIVLDQMPTRSAWLAAEEFRAHIRKITGAEIPVITAGTDIESGVLPVYIGESPATRLKGLTSSGFAPQEYLVKIERDAVYLIGRDDKDFGPVSYEENGAWPGFNERRPFYRLGTLHAVYDLLESYWGVRWYMPGELGTVIHEKSTLTLPRTEKTVRPWTTYRLPSKTGWQIAGELIGRGEQHTAMSAREANLFTLRSRIGGEPYSVSHSVGDYHIRFGDDHPEWFVGGQPGRSIQLRYDHPEVLKQLTKDALEFFDRPFSERRFGTKDTAGGRVSSGKFFSVMPKDNRDYGDETNPPLQPERRGEHSGTGVASNYIWSAVNEVAGNIAEIYPDYYITNCAYAAHFEPPEFPLEPNVAVTVVMADGWGGYGMEILKEWRRRVGRLYTWEWYIDHIFRFPRVRPRAIAGYIDELKNMGIDGMFIEMPSLPGLQNRNPGLYHINYYVTFRLLREKNADIDFLLQEYYRLFYGPAARPMELFWSTLEEAYEQSNTDDYMEAAGSREMKEWTMLASPRRMKVLREAIARAESLAGREPYLSRIRLVKDTALGRIESSLEDYLEVDAMEVPVISVPMLDVSIDLDGRLEEVFWQEAAATDPFVTLYAEALDTETIAYAARDGEYLYIGFECEEPFMEEQRLDQRVSTAGVCTDDSVEFVIDVGRKYKDYLHVMMNAEGLMWYRWVGRYRSQDDFDFDPGIEGGAWRGDDLWTAEFKIPLSTLAEFPPEGGEAWGVNFYRNRWPRMQWRDPRRWTAWSPIFARGYHVVDRFGVMKFEKENTTDP